MKLPCKITWWTPELCRTRWKLAHKGVRYDTKERKKQSKKYESDLKCKVFHLQLGAEVVLFPLHYLALAWQRGGRSRVFRCPLALDQPNTASSPVGPQKHRNMSQHSDVRMKRRRDLTRPHILLVPKYVSVLCNGIRSTVSS